MKNTIKPSQDKTVEKYMEIKKEDIQGKYDLTVDIKKIYGLCNSKHDWVYCPDCEGYLCNNCDEIK